MNRLGQATRGLAGIGWDMAGSGLALGCWDQMGWVGCAGVRLGRDELG